MEIKIRQFSHQIPIWTLSLYPLTGHVIKGGYSENMPRKIFNIDTSNFADLNKSQLIKDMLNIF
jgi:hypothetical protein